MTESMDGGAPDIASPDGLPLSVTSRTRHRRLREQGRPDRAALRDVLRAGLIAHLGVVIDGVPMVVPTSYGFDERTIYVHGSVASLSLQDRPGAVICVTVTVADGLVLARSLFEHAVNYRCAMIYGVPRLLTGEKEVLHGLRCLSDHAVPGQWEYARQPNRKELAATTVLALPLDEASVKIRTGGPEDADTPDAALGLWAGELPISTTWGAPVPDSALQDGIAVPDHIGGRAGTQVHPGGAGPGTAG